MGWIYENKNVEALPEGCIGFVYCITNNLTNRKYIGKKAATFSARSGRAKKVLNGIEKVVQPGRLQSDWRSYYGSNKDLLQDVIELGEEEFTREILYFCYTKSEMNYLEAKEQFDRNVLLTDEYYNKLINCRINANNFRR